MLAECFTAETLTQVQPDWKCLIYKRERKKKKQFQRFFFLFLKLLNSGSATPVGMKEENGKLLVGWAEVLHLLSGVLLPLCNVIPSTVLGSLQSFGRSSAGADYHRLEEIRGRAGSPCTTLAYLHRWPGPTASPSPCPLGRYRPCLGPSSNTPV